MARRKPKNFHPIKDLKAANAALFEIAGIKRALASRQTRMNEKIDQIKAETEADAAPFHTRLAALENGLLAYAEFFKDELFEGRRSRDLDFGRLGYRKSSKLKPKPKTTWAMILGRLKEMGFDDAVRTKESVNKDEMHTWPDERLDLVGAKRDEKDAFWYELNEQRIEEKDVA